MHAAKLNFIYMYAYMIIIFFSYNISSSYHVKFCMIIISFSLAVIKSEFAWLSLPSL